VCFSRSCPRNGVRFSEQRINIKFCTKLKNNASDTCEILSEVYGGKAVKSKVFSSGINGPKRVAKRGI
jgi:uncharacterized metal-binding protein